ncbi:chemotaxis protein CheW [Paractinoplanes abujensis]|uniref:Chemotaxis protein CheW n=1 Tax=Paractinoplanes abujensis TaxID=882441 RepID=A0A7W7CQC0_9ACTN|nr:chemotaxis protein CheW [Actinoplanes abujensis]MBB4692713.1 purine-binding chemotaxis protein CheW [Actinoplanes abujensis]GID22788.1 chemotaxis protein CheW [Actinoplanes abujensis]
MTSEDDRGEENDGGNADYVTFDMVGERYAFPMSQVQEIIRMPAVVKVPLGPPALEGLANLRGRVLPVVSLRECCSMETAEHDETTRVIIVDGGVPLGFVVDRVASVISIDPADMEPADSVQSTVRSDVLVGVIKAKDGLMTSVLDVDRLVGSQFDGLAEAAAAREPASTAARMPESEGETESDDTLELVSFAVQGQEYALPIDQVQEIVQAPESVSHVPNSGGRVLGVIDLRGRLLPVVSMRRVFGLPVTPLEPQNRIVVVSLDGGVVGVVMDTVREVLRVPHQLVAPLPAFMATDGRKSEVESVCRLEDGKRLVSVLNVNRMFDSPEVRNEIAEHQDREDGPPMTEEQRDDDGRGDEELFVVFRLDAEEYAVDVDAVQEIIRVPEALIRVPRSFEFVEGLVNLRGTVLPVVDLRTRLGLPRGERDERQRIVVLIIGGVRTGFIVDSVAEVARVGRHVLEPAPQLSAEQARIVSRVANLPEQKRMLLLVQVGELLAAEQARDLEAVLDEVVADVLEPV